MKKFIITIASTEEVSEEHIRSVLYLGNQEAGVGTLYPEIPTITVKDVAQVTYGEGRMTFEQREKLWAMCGRYGVPFRETDYHRSAIGYGSYADLPPSYEGWVGGDFYSNNKAGGQKTIYVMVEHDGRSHS